MNKSLPADSNKAMRIVFADDEQPAREKLAHQLSLIPDIEVIGFATTGKEAVALINETRPDLALLDIQMPEIDGMELLSLLEHQPQVIFTTAYDQYAIQAFENASTDYLLKPFPLARLKSAIDKARLVYQQRQLAAAPAFSLNQAGNKKRLISKNNDRITLLYPENLFYIHSEQGSSLASDGDSLHVLSETLDQLEQSLEYAQFVRIHRSYLINLDKIKEIQRWFNGKLMVIMADRKNTELSTSRAGADKLKQILGL
ncbi:LytR/AlgR family response regulator transcription factor [Thalassomonas haliotis]|uniref:Response regulator n=1 Tax=Thalassomonas haliotis TaxID=485448 RepID=A0ABY7VH60_9GAMM|nr:response regulator [Thalassomonas haliotis]WDE13069.1 response regulator [Thalassomonas haliotis]